MIPVGIHKNLVITNTSVTEEKNGKALNVTFKEAGAQAANTLEAMLGSTATGSTASREQNFKLFSFNVTKADGSTKTGDDLIKAVTARREQLNHILLQYMTADKIDWKPLEVPTKLGIKTIEDLAKKITVQANLDQMFEQQCARFIDMMKKFVGEDGKKLLAKFNRSSATSNFPKLPERWLDTQPFLAPMDDVAACAKVKYSDWDIKNNVNNPARSLNEVDVNPEDLAKQKEQLETVFGSTPSVEDTPFN